MIELTSNNAKTTVEASLPASGAGSNTLTVVSGTGALFPQPGTTNYPVGAATFFRLSLTDAATQTKREIVYVTARNTDSMTILRGQDGTSAQAWAVGDIVGLFVVSGTQANVMQMEQAQSGYINYAIAGGTPNALTASFNPSLLENLTAGVTAKILIGSNNTGPVTLNLDGLGVVPVVNARGVALVANELIGGVTYVFTFTGQQFVVDTNQPALFFQDTSNAANTLKISTGVNATSLGRGFVIYVTVANTNSGPVTMTLDGLTGVPVLSREGAAFQSNILLAGSTYRFIYNGSAFIAEASNQTAAQIGEIRMWNGSPGAVASTWGFGWHLCDGTNGTPNLVSRFIMGAGSTVAVGSTGGSATTTLSAANLPSHNHAVNDPGHVHSINDRGHVHGINDPGHAHGVADYGHSHGINDPGHAHTVNRGGWGQAGQDNGGIAGASAPNQYGTYSGAMSQVTGSGTGISIAGSGSNIGIYASGTGIGTQAAATGVSVVTGATGITTANTGSGSPVSTLPPYYALCFVIYTNS
ncbi:hypothetical protein [Paraburkholderia sediminicola]|uniref:hypothetical protein n=1 Tax=Paraburkholderia sediminicola TaxID=458836 RepID=UPI0038BCC958